MTNLIILSSLLVTNTEQAVIGQTNGQAIMGNHERVERVTEYGFKQKRDTIKTDEKRVIVSSRVWTNFVRIAFVPPVSQPTVVSPPAATQGPRGRRGATKQPPVVSKSAVTNAPSRMREQRERTKAVAKPATNAPPTVADLRDKVRKERAAKP